MNNSESVEIEIIRKAYDALNRGDVDGFVASFDENIERVEFAETPNGKIIHGLDAVREHVTEGRGTWAEGGCFPQRIIADADKIIVLSHVRVRLRDHEDWLEGDVADVFIFRDGKAILFRTFDDARLAFEFAGIDGE